MCSWKCSPACAGERLRGGSAHAHRVQSLTGVRVKDSLGSLGHTRISGVSSRRAGRERLMLTLPKGCRDAETLSLDTGEFNTHRALCQITHRLWLGLRVSDRILVSSRCSQESLEHIGWACGCLTASRSHQDARKRASRILRVMIMHRASGAVSLRPSKSGVTGGPNYG